MGPAEESVRAWLSIQVSGQGISLRTEPTGLSLDALNRHVDNLSINILGSDNTLVITPLVSGLLKLLTTKLLSHQGLVSRVYSIASPFNHRREHRESV